MEDPLKSVPANIKATPFRNPAFRLRTSVISFRGFWAPPQRCIHLVTTTTSKAATCCRFALRSTTLKTGPKPAITTTATLQKEIAQFSQPGTDNEQADCIHSSDVLYSYEHDSNRNWTVKRSTSRALPDGQLRDLTEVRRSIEYY
jgi:hypothetical protein